MTGRAYLPVAVNMRGRSALVVGSGEAAYFKALLLVDFGVPTTVIAPPDGADDFDPRLCDLQRGGSVSLHRRAYAPSDLDGHTLAIVATGNRAADYAVEADARARGVLVNVVDDPDHCDFFASAYVRHGPVSIAVNSGGASPGFTAALKDDLAERYGPEVEEHVGHYLRWRRLVRERIDTARERELFWRGLRAAGLYAVLRGEGPEAAWRLIEARLARRTADDGAAGG